jgi:nucleotidyltransferase/DNA polymerase involved in DNA repair
MARIILHIDLDAFYASVEERDNPQLKGKPVVVGADPQQGTGRGVVSTCNYAARKFGVHSGMPISIAYRKCPDCSFVPVDMDKYVQESIKCQEIFRKYAGAFEIGGIDEFYLDISQRCKTYKEAEKLAKDIQEELLQKRKLTCSIGISSNRLVAKIAADKEKPNGITIVREDYISDFLAPLDIGELLGVGPKTKAKLNELDIFTIKDLRKISKYQLVEWLGKFGAVLYDEARGIDESPIVEEWEVKSIGRQFTFLKDTKDKKLIFEKLVEMINDTIKQTKGEKKSYKTITIKVRYEDFHTLTKAKTLAESHNDEKTAQLLARELLIPFLRDPRKIRLIGFSVSKLS